MGNKMFFLEGGKDEDTRYTAKAEEIANMNFRLFLKMCFKYL